MKRPHFSVRTALYLIALLAIAVGWLADRQRLQNRLYEAAVKDLQQRQSLFAMQKENDQLKANAAAPSVRDWRMQGNYYRAATVLSANLAD